MQRKIYNYKFNKVQEIKMKIQSNRCYCHLLPEICEEIGIKYNTMRQWFKVIENITLNKYCQKCKLEYIKGILSNTNDKIYIIAYETGFRNDYHLIRWFKAKTGKTPTLFRKCQNWL